MNEYNTSTCTLHELNVKLSSATELTMGSGVILKRTALQLLHSAYNLSQQFRRNEWHSIQELVNHKGCNQLVAPVFSRCECVGEACEHVIQNYNEWKVLVRPNVCVVIILVVKAAIYNGIYSRYFQYV